MFFSRNFKKISSKNYKSGNGFRT